MSRTRKYHTSYAHERERLTGPSRSLNTETCQRGPDVYEKSIDRCNNRTTGTTAAAVAGMSIETMSHVLGLDVGDSTRKLVLIGYANHAHADGTAAFPGVATVARYANCSTRTVQRHVAQLLEDGYLREGDQSLVALKRADQRPIVYDVAMSSLERDRWRADATDGRRAQAAHQGRIGGHVSAINAQVARGDNLTPRAESEFSQVNRGDNLSPRPDGLRGDTESPNGVTPVTERGDTAVSPKPSLTHPGNHPAAGREHAMDTAAAERRAPGAAAAKSIVLRTLPDVSGDEAAAIVERVRTEKRPRDLAAMVAHIAGAGELPDLLDDVRLIADEPEAVAVVDAVAIAARTGKQLEFCDHGGLAGVHPVTGIPLCVLCARQIPRQGAAA